MSTEDRLPAGLRVAPTTEPTVEVDVGAHVPPEAAVVAVTHDEGQPGPPGERGGAGASYEALAAMEAAGEQADPSPAELRVAPTPERTVDVGEDAHVPPEAGVIPVVHRTGRDPAS
jgi:hypothetical protein